MQIVRSNKEDWQTPPEIFNPLHEKYNFTIDGAANAKNHLLPKYWSKEYSAFKGTWAGERIWINPPYGRKYPEWVEFAFRKCMSKTDSPEFVCMLIPASTDTKLFHNIIWAAYKNNFLDLKFSKGRIHFIDPETGDYARDKNGKKQSPQFGSLFILIRGTNQSVKF
jgi:site-specific DNA-methyltransferase (adenine-specific)